MRVRRDVSSVPFRSAGETWQQIIDLVTGTGSKDIQQLKGAAGVMGSIITDEHPAAAPLHSRRRRARSFRIYCRYGMKAVEEGGKVDSLTWNPTAGDWTMHVPCDEENLEWVKKSLAASAPRIKAFDVAGAERAEEEGECCRREKQRRCRCGLEHQGDILIYEHLRSLANLHPDSQRCVSERQPAQYAPRSHSRKRPQPEQTGSGLGNDRARD